MSPQSQILAQMQEIVMNILKTGDLSAEDGEKMDALETQLHQQKCFVPSQKSEFEYVGEEIAALFLSEEFEAGVQKLKELEILPEDFFGFAEYHFEDEDETEMFDADFMQRVNEAYKA